MPCDRITSRQHAAGPRALLPRPRPAHSADSVLQWWTALPPKEMGIILGVAALLDAVLIRLILLPVLLRLTGHGAWWSPAWLTKVLPSITFTH
ncbi:hypothetical protein [Antrihabitans spumae]|uniref:Membrane transport protein MMPL domain-containing protein n=1 Tax=Antrihabitans spumae TaxID=3373370 RepID=A0ABW7JWU6_9NOCA